MVDEQYKTCKRRDNVTLWRNRFLIVIDAFELSWILWKITYMNVYNINMYMSFMIHKYVHAKIRSNFEPECEYQ